MNSRSESRVRYLAGSTLIASSWGSIAYHAERRVGFVAVGVRREPRVVLRHSAEVAQTRGSVVAGPGVYAGQVNCHSQTVLGPHPRKLTLPHGAVYTNRRERAIRGDRRKP